MIGTLIKTPFKVQRYHEKSTGWRGLSILDGDGLAVCNVIGRLDDREVEVARLICAAVNKLCPARKPKRERIPF